MKQLVSLLILAISLFTFGPAFTQPLGPAYVVYFTDKANSPYSIDNPSEFLTEAAIDRRVRQGIEIQEDDIPVNTTYLEAITNAGAQIAAVSRWFNTAGVWIFEPDSIPVILNLPFVAGVEPMSGRAVKRDDKWQGKPFFEAEWEDAGAPSALNKSVTSDYFDYGSAFNQIDMVNGIGLHNQGFRGQGMIVAVLDAGFRNVDVNPAFDSLRVHNRILGTRDFVTPGNNVYHPGIHPHGANVLSIMGAHLPGQMVGTAPEASYWLIRTEDADGPWGKSEYLMEEYFWVAGAEFADSVGAWVINSSLGYSEFDDPSQNHTYADLDGNTTPVTRGANHAASKGILVVNSAGNSGNSPWQHIIAPADGFDVMAVGAVDANGDYAFFSSLGPSYDGRIKPDVAAQGLGTFIVNPGGAVASGNGTSFSSPIIAGMAACLWQTYSNATNSDIYNAIIQSGSQFTDPDNLLGYGIPDFAKAHFLLTFDTTVARSNGSISVYPNPAIDHIVVRAIKAGNYIHRIEVYDLLGKSVITTDYGRHGFIEVHENIALLKAGFYLLMVHMDSGTEAVRLVKR